MQKKEKFEGLSIISGLFVCMVGAGDLIPLLPKLFQDFSSGNFDISFGSPVWDLLRGVLLLWIGRSIIKLTWKKDTKNI